jgi:hypothetical protein
VAGSRDPEQSTGPRRGRDEAEAVPEADAADQSREVGTSADDFDELRELDVETPEADALDQARSAPLDEDFEGYEP